MYGLEDKIAIVTGSACGIGKSIAQRLAQEGARVIVADVNGEKAVATALELGEKAEAYRIDLRKIPAIEQMMQTVWEKYGRIDILINDAGVQIREWATDFDVEKFDFLMDLNLRAYYFASRTVAKYMQQQGGGAIVCISSGNSTRYTTKRSPYNISKAAVNGLVGTLGVEWARFGIRINAVAPGFVLTDMVKQGIQEGIIDVENNFKVIPMKRLLDPMEIANGVCFLASDQASGITGQTLFIDGGWSQCGLPEEKDM